MFSFGTSAINSIKTGLFSRGFLAQNIPQVGNITTKRWTHEYAPRFKRVRKQHKGRVPVRTGGSIKGSSVEFGQYGLRLKSMGVRLAAIQLKEADAAIMRMMRPVGGKLIRRICTSIAVCTKGNETRMGKGKGPFDYWAARIPIGKVIFEIGGNVHEKVARDALRKAGDKLPGVWEFVKKGDIPRVGLKAFKAKEEPINYKEKLEAEPTKEYRNIQKSKESLYQLYKGR